MNKSDLMKKFRPSNRAIAIGISLMVAGLLCWIVMSLIYTNVKLVFLAPLGLLLLCLGGLELTIVAFITMRKNEQIKLMDKSSASNKQK